MMLECIIARIHNSEVEELNIQSPSFVIINSGMLVDAACPGHWANASIWEYLGTIIASTLAATVLPFILGVL